MRRWAVAPMAVVLGVLFGSPLAILGVYTVLTRGAYGGVGQPWTLENWGRLWDPLYLAILAKSFVVAGVVTGATLGLGVPLALFIARSQRKSLFLGLVMLPFWTSLLVRTYAWMYLLRDTGLINSALLKLGWIQEPLPLLYNWGAVTAGLVYAYLPFMVLPVYAALESQERALEEAAADLGAREWEVLRRVTLPLARPGMRAGAVLVFVPTLGAYLTPDLLGGGKTILVGTLIQNQFAASRDWAFGSALSMGLMGIVLVLLWLEARR